MATTLPLFWNVSSASKDERLDASVKLVSTLQHFQAQFVPKDSSSSSSSEGEEDEADGGSTSDGLDALNAPDVSYSIRRLVRGLASPRESSRLGFAVTLTELLSRLKTITSSQVLRIIVDYSQSHGSMSGQELRDVLLARLFGLHALARSGLLFRRVGATGEPPSSLACYREAISHLLVLGEKKSWLRESAWWTLGAVMDALVVSDVEWREDAVDAAYEGLFRDGLLWSPERVALTAKLQALHPDRDWGALLQPTFRHPDLLHLANLKTLSKLLKEAHSSEEDEHEQDAKAAAPGTWKPRPHFVWDVLLDTLLPGPNSPPKYSTDSFREFFRIVVDESLFSSSASPTRKYWGFQVFLKALTHPHMNADKMCFLFTKNFMRCWINQLSGKDRLLNKAAQQVASSIPPLVQRSPTLGFTLIAQLTGVNGSQQFDKLTRTKTVESVLAAMDAEGISKYIEWLLGQTDDDHTAATVDVQALNARRLWVIDQLASLSRNGAIPKDDHWVMAVLNWFVVRGLFVVRKGNAKSAFLAVRAAPKPAFSDDLRKACRVRLLSCLAELTTHVTVVKGEAKSNKIPGVASDGVFWIVKTLHSITQLEMDTKHLRLAADVDESEKLVYEKAMETVEALKKIPEDPLSGVQLLLVASLVYNYCADDPDKIDTDTIESCTDAAKRRLHSQRPNSKKSRKSEGAEESAVEPIDVFVDAIIGFLEKPVTYLRVIGNQAFALLSADVRESTVDLILAQLERRDPSADEDQDDDLRDTEEDDEDMGKGDEDEDGDENEDMDEDEDDSVSIVESSTNDDEDLDPEFRRLLEEALRINGVGQPDEQEDEDSEELMDDEQMMAIDEQLAEIFKSRANASGKDVNAHREATHFKNRVLDLVDLLVKHQSTSPYIVRLISPLIELLVGSGTDERQLSEKTSGILTSRIGKLKDVPSSINSEQIIQVLGDLHVRARKAHDAKHVAVLSQCILYLSRLLLHFQLEEPVLQVYRESLLDFAKRKASPLNPAFFQAFFQKHPCSGWKMKDTIIKASTKSVNGFRQCQCLQLFQHILNQTTLTPDRHPEVLTFIPKLSNVLLDTLAAASGEANVMSAAQMKDVLKLGLFATRQTKRVCTPGEMSNIWQSKKWDELGTKFIESKRYNASSALHTICQEIARASRSPAVDTASKAGKRPSVDGVTKRKADERGERAREKQKKARRRNFES